MASTVNNNFDFNGIADYKLVRYNQSLNDNPNFLYGPTAVIIYAAAAFLYEVFPNYGPEGSPDLATISSFFGTTSIGNGQFSASSGEKIPANWHNSRTPYTITQVADSIIALYTKHPVLLGGNIGKGNFDALGTLGTAIKDGKLVLDQKAVLCLLYQLGLGFAPSTLSGTLQEVLKFATGKLNPIFQTFGCPLQDF